MKKLHTALLLLLSLSIFAEGEVVKLSGEYELVEGAKECPANFTITEEENCYLISKDAVVAQKICKINEGAQVTRKVEVHGIGVVKYLKVTDLAEATEAELKLSSHLLRRNAFGALEDNMTTTQSFTTADEVLTYNLKFSHFQLFKMPVIEELSCDYRSLTE